MAEDNENPEETVEVSGAAEEQAQGHAEEAGAEAPTLQAPAVPVEAAAATEAVQAAPKARLRDRAWSFRAMLAVGVATLLIGGAGGAGIVALADGGNDHGPRIGRLAGGPGGPGGFGGQRLGGRRGGGGGFGQNGPGAGFGQGQQGNQQGQQGGQQGTPNPEAPPSGSAS
jgi:hypothetical protein